MAEPTKQKPPAAPKPEAKARRKPDAELAALTKMDLMLQGFDGETARRMIDWLEARVESREPQDTRGDETPHANGTGNA